MKNGRWQKTEDRCQMTSQHGGQAKPIADFFLQPSNFCRLPYTTYPSPGFYLIINYGAIPRLNDMS
jgi:hypothetical protein